MTDATRIDGAAAVSWSGGKDSCMALILAAESGLAVTTLLTLADPDGSSKSHALPERPDRGAGPRDGSCASVHRG